MAKYFTCHTKKAPYAYLVNEEIAFRVVLKEDGKQITAPFFHYELAADFGYQESKTVSGIKGEFTVITSLHKPGYIYLKAWVSDGDGNPLPGYDLFYGGAGVSVRDIVSVTEKPADYDAFWEECRRESLCLEPILLNEVQLPTDPDHPSHDIYDIRVAAVGGIPVSGILTVPRDGKKHPARVVYQGYGVKSAWFNFADDEIILCINAHGIENAREDAYYEHLANTVLKDYGFDKEQNKSPHTCYFKYMMLRAAQALKYMMTRPEWDGKHLIARGGSQGAVQAMHATYLVPEVTLLDIFVPWLCDIQAASIGRLCGWGEFTGNAMRYFDLSIRAKDIHTPTVILAGLGDYTSPPAGVTAMYHNLQGEKKLNLVQSREHIYVSPEAETFTVTESCIKQKESF